MQMLIRVISFLTILIGHTIFSTLLQYFYYFPSSLQACEWKIQRFSFTSSNDTSLKFQWWLPIINNKRNRASFHYIIATLNLIVASFFSCLVSDLYMKGYSYLTCENIWHYGVFYLFYDVVIAITIQSVLEYYWHRLMHIPMFYKLFHKYHHHYKSPEPFDDLYIHPIEAIGYYCILHSPPFLFPCHLYAYIIYMIILGTCGVLDHSGIYLYVPLLYNTRDHDLHHSKFDVNYSFPFPFMDILHGTYEGVFLGKEYRRNR